MGKARVKKTTKKAKEVAPKKKAGSARGSSLAAMHSKLQRLDRDLVKTFNERARLAAKVAKRRGLKTRGSLQWGAMPRR